MVSCIFTALVGILCIVLGCINMTGNISTLHSYHTKRVKEEDRKPFGKLVGIGTVIIGISVIIFSIFNLVFEFTSKEIYITIGNVVMIAGIVIGIGISFYAMKKYNKGIF